MKVSVGASNLEEFVFEKAFQHGGFLASLASSGESDDGGLVPPPRKKVRTSLEGTTMQQAANGCSPQQNGTSESRQGITQNGTDDCVINGDVNGEIIPKTMDKTNQEIVRLVGQYLKSVGLK